MISRDDALDSATEALHRADHLAALAWTALAAELRAQPEPAGARLTLHDIEARQCRAHGLIAVRDKRASMSWWLHVDNHAMCTDAD